MNYIKTKPTQTEKVLSGRNTREKSSDNYLFSQALYETAKKRVDKQNLPAAEYQREMYKKTFRRNFSFE